MVKLLLVLLAFGLSTAQAQEQLQRAEILGAKYDSVNRAILIDVAYTGGCNDIQSLQITNCNMIMEHHVCAAVVNVSTDSSCSALQTTTMEIYRDQLSFQSQNLDSKKFDNMRMIIRGSKTKKEVSFGI